MPRSVMSHTVDHLSLRYKGRRGGGDGFTKEGSRKEIRTNASPTREATQSTRDLMASWKIEESAKAKVPSEE